jgi:KDO2-lipid IV(A) lauroyltransferase
MGSGARPKRQRKVVVDYFVYFVIRVLLCVMQALPESACQLLAKGLAWGFCDVCHFRSQVVDDNLRHAFPAASARRRMQICRGMWQHLMLLAFEIGRANRKIHETNWRDYVSFDGARNLVACQLDGRPVVIVTGHFGNFEISGYVAGLLGLPNFTVARPLDNRFLHDFIGRFRHSTGQQIISSRGSADLVGKVLEAGASLAVLGDHYGGPKGCWIEFFHRPASCHKSIALLALSYEAPLIVFHTQRTGRMLHFKLVANPNRLDPRDTDCPKSVTEITQWYSTQLERAITACPEQYWWLHRRWKDTRADIRRQRRKKRVRPTLRVDPSAKVAELGKARSSDAAPAGERSLHD